MFVFVSGSVHQEVSVLEHTFHTVMEKSFRTPFEGYSIQLIIVKYLPGFFLVSKDLSASVAKIEKLLSWRLLI